MSISLRSSARIGSQRPTHVHLPSDRRGSSGPEAVALAEIAGLALDDWQRWILEEALSEASDRQWSAFEVAVLVGRQNGKGTILEARQLAGLFLLGERLQVHTAHEFKTGFEHFLRIVHLIESTPDLDLRVRRIRRGAGEQAIELMTGERLRFLARSSGSGRGLSGDTVYLDEAFALTAPMMGALLPTLSARPNPQIWYTSSAPMTSSTVLHDVRRRGLKGASPRLFMAEWGGVDVDIDDRDAWYRTNPALGIRITEESIESELDALRATPDEFARERLGVPAEPIFHGTRLELSAFLWAAVCDRSSQIVGRLAFAVDVAPDAVSASIAAAGDRPDGRGSVEIIESAQGTRWVCDTLAAKIETNQPSVVAVDAAGPVNQLLPEIEAVCKAARVKLVKLAPRAYAAACGEFVDAVKDKRVAHLGQQWLDDAVAAGRRRSYGDAWMWDRRVGVDVSPLVAATVARRASVEASEVSAEPLFAYS